MTSVWASRGCLTQNERHGGGPTKKPCRGNAALSQMEREPAVRAEILRCASHAPFRLHIVSETAGVDGRRWAPAALMLGPSHSLARLPTRPGRRASRSRLGPGEESRRTTCPAARRRETRSSQYGLRCAPEPSAAQLTPGAAVRPPGPLPPRHGRRTLPACG